MMIFHHDEIGSSPIPIFTFKYIRLLKFNGTK